METISILIDIIIVLFFLAAGLGFMAFPILFNADIKNKTGKAFLNPWLTGIELICLIGCFNPDSDDFYGNVGCLILSVVIASLIAWKKAQKLHLANKTVIKGVIAQIFSPVSILFIVFMLERLVSSLKQDRKK